MAELAVPQFGLDPADRQAREEALDTSTSVLVQAPAGSGKTELLALRFLKLLAEVDQPEEVLGITFSRAATAEILHRIVGKLERAREFGEGVAATDEEDPAKLAIAATAYAHSVRRNWRLLEQPQRLNIQTIDSLCLQVAHRKPLTAGPGGMLQPTEQASALYRRAARKTFDQLGGADIELDAALRALLLLRDGNLAGCEGLVADMLSTRNQWMRIFPVTTESTGLIDWTKIRSSLEEPLQRAILPVLEEAHRLLSFHPDLTHELLELADYACGGEKLKIEISLLAGLTSLPSPLPDFLEHWRCFCELLLTQKDDLRKSVNIENGFPPDDDGQKQRMKDLLLELAGMPELVDLLLQIRNLPPPHYTETEWQSLRHIFVVLRHAAAELRAVFSEQGMVDFVEVSIAAIHVLNGESPGAQRIQHLLIDEFQDTSRNQHELVSALLRDWTASSSQTLFDRPRTVFLVGDPMQSIYLFRQAEVELFDRVRQRGLTVGSAHLPLKNLRLSTNFRSNAGVVNPLNALFATVFPHKADPSAAPVDFLPGTPGDPSEPPGAYEVHPNVEAAGYENRKQATAEARRRETEEILRVIANHQPAIDRARKHGQEFSIAVLARAKNHLIAIAAALRDAKIPFRAIELETLVQRQEVLDLQSLTRALLHPMDRVAWLALLRAPWCGLALRELHILCGTDGPHSANISVAAQIEENLPLLEERARESVSRVLSLLQQAGGNRYRQSSFSSWIERTWNSLGGPACVDSTGYENARAYFRMLDQVSPDGIAATGEAMDDQLNRLFASPDPSVGERLGVQLMSMHKSKGLGFDVVILPGLHRKAGNSPSPLVRYLERASGAETEFLAAPIGEIGAKPRINEWVRKQKEKRETEERKRLLYVACTRARQELHLFATAAVTNRGTVPNAGSLLDTAWPALQINFNANGSQQPGTRPVGLLTEFPATQGTEEPQESVLDSIAAGADARSGLYRLPSEWKPSPPMPNVCWSSSQAADLPGEATSEARPQASRSSRILGTTVHTLFERAAQLFGQGASDNDLRAKLDDFRTQAATLARNEGMAPQEAESTAATVRLALENALSDPRGLWILKSHAEARTESSWTGMIDHVPRTLRIDRSFRAGSEPLSGDGNCLWIIDYKTATHGKSGLPEFLDNERRQYEDQLQSYGKMMRLVRGDDQELRFGLYYPLLRELVWWRGEI